VRWSGLTFDIHTLPIEIPGPRLRLVWHDRIDADAAHRWLRQMVQAACRMV